MSGKKSWEEMSSEEQEEFSLNKAQRLVKITLQMLEGFSRSSAAEGLAELLVPVQQAWEKLQADPDLFSASDAWGFLNEQVNPLSARYGPPVLCLRTQGISKGRGDQRYVDPSTWFSDELALVEGLYDLYLAYLNEEAEWDGAQEQDFVVSAEADAAAEPQVFTASVPFSLETDVKYLATKVSHLHDNLSGKQAPRRRRDGNGWYILFPRYEHEVTFADVAARIRTAIQTANWILDHYPHVSLEDSLLEEVDSLMMRAMDLSRGFWARWWAADSICHVCAEFQKGHTTWDDEVAAVRAKLDRICPIQPKEGAKDVRRWWGQVTCATEDFEVRITALRALQGKLSEIEEKRRLAEEASGAPAVEPAPAEEPVPASEPIEEPAPAEVPSDPKPPVRKEFQEEEGDPATSKNKPRTRRNGGRRQETRGSVAAAAIAAQLEEEAA